MAAGTPIQTTLRGAGKSVGKGTAGGRGPSADERHAAEPADTPGGAADDARGADKQPRRRPRKAPRGARPVTPTYIHISLLYTRTRTLFFYTLLPLVRCAP